VETSLHRQLKERYADDRKQVEVRLGDYRIDAIAGDKLVEIQHGSLAAIRDKIQKLVQKHDVLLVKPVVARKHLVKLREKDGPVVERRRSPKRGCLLDIFDELVYFTRVFPHPRLTLEVPLVEVEEYRYPGHGRRRRRRKRDHVAIDQRLLEVTDVHQFSTADDLARLAPVDKLPVPFHTGHLAEAMELDRWIARRIAYCFREMGVTNEVGKKGNALLYEFARAKAA
jgi:hypothetical protein